ncbi:hypothetical protein HETIRDRAFT_419813 [Heterobasidion irregulare TC 32-1]|uniref:Uncharacterized protein n=1 Tax=Heterobasidion irregulare (strain TC 32-1) TaxID=747525 RepID=W4JYC3_HETIT|nr:uncharacterized protein HETIRDRAFT_419813 [Heterobasidion irregulare TC 32-1]ETW78543.1 hypothetical protein HETIRDRAFT_419813 [Heterobasidion irregulare TC 32-1]
MRGVTGEWVAFPEGPGVFDLQRSSSGQGSFVVRRVRPFGPVRGDVLFPSTIDGE